MIEYFHAHPELYFVAYWCVSAWLSTMPPLPPNAGFWFTWLHGMVQFLAGNWGKIARTPLDGQLKG